VTRWSAAPGKRASSDVLDASAASGLNFIDTAAAYDALLA